MITDTSEDRKKLSYKATITSALNALQQPNWPHLWQNDP